MSVHYKDDELKLWKNEDCPYLKPLKRGKWGCSKFRFNECKMLMSCKVVYVKREEDDEKER